jgi:hypothetical protein
MSVRLNEDIKRHAAAIARMWELLPAYVSRSLATDDGEPNPCKPTFIKVLARRDDEELLAVGWEWAGNAGHPTKKSVLVVLARHGRRGFRPLRPLDGDALAMARQLGDGLQPQSVAFFDPASARVLERAGVERYAAAAIRMRELLPAEISRGLRTDHDGSSNAKPIYVQIVAPDAGEELLFAGWKWVPSENPTMTGWCLVVVARCRGEDVQFLRPPADDSCAVARALKDDHQVVVFFDPETRNPLYFESESAHLIIDPASGRPLGRRPVKSNPRNATRIAQEMDGLLEAALSEITEKPLVKRASIPTAFRAPPPSPRVCIFPTDDKCQHTAYNAFRSLMNKHTKSVFFPEFELNSSAIGLKITRAKLPFYPRFDLFEIEIERQNRVRRSFIIASLKHNEPPVYLNLRSKPIHDQNTLMEAKYSLNINDQRLQHILSFSANLCMERKANFLL